MKYKVGDIMKKEEVPMGASFRIVNGGGKEYIKVNKREYMNRRGFVSQFRNNWDLELVKSIPMKLDKICQRIK